MEKQFDSMFFHKSFPNPLLPAPRAGDNEIFYQQKKEKERNG